MLSIVRKAITSVSVRKLNTSAVKSAQVAQSAWVKPQAQNTRSGFEMTAYIANKLD